MKSGMQPASEEYCFLGTPLGWLKISADAGGVTRIEVVDEPPMVLMTVTLPHLKEAYRQLAEYFRGERLRFSVPLNPRHDDLEPALMARLTAIPFGTTIAWDELMPQGGASRRNPLPILIPCHRVIGAESAFSGLAPHTDFARQLLRLEGAAP